MQKKVYFALLVIGVGITVVTFLMSGTHEWASGIGGFLIGFSAMWIVFDRMSNKKRS